MDGFSTSPLSNVPCGFVDQVLSKGHGIGPAGVEVKLSRAGTEERTQSVVTQPGGK